jgi:hypothetical protein
VAANAVGVLKAIVVAKTATTNIAARPAEGQRHANVLQRPLALFLRLRQ